jgi:hypothetical protein
LKRSSDEITVEESQSALNSGKHWRKRGKCQTTSTPQKRKFIDFNRNPTGINQFTKKENQNGDMNSAPQTPSTSTFKFTIGSNDLGRRLAKRMRFVKSPSKITCKKRKKELLKVSKIAAIKALGCVSAKPEKVFSLLCEHEVPAEQNQDSVTKCPAELKGVRIALQQSLSGFEKKRILSIVAREYSYKSLLKHLGQKISRAIFTEARLYARAYGPGADPPDLKLKTIAFTEADVKRVSQFVLSSENCTGLAWGEKNFTTTEGQQYSLPNFQRKHDAEQIWKKFETLQRTDTTGARKIKRNKFLEIVKAITNSQSTSFAALDNINVRFGSENFVCIRKLINDVAERFPQGISEDIKEQLLKLCDDSESFLKHTFPSHLQQESECAAHCRRFALADHVSKSAMKPCLHAHNKFCQDCELPHRMFMEIRSVIEDASEGVQFII